MLDVSQGGTVRVPCTGKLTQKRAWAIPRNCYKTWFLALSLLALLAFVEAPLTAEFVRVKVNKANIRSGPGTRYEKTWVVPRNYPYRVLKREGKWLKVKDFEGFEDWIYGPLTDQKPAAVVKVERANVRKGPGTGYPILFKADIGVPFRVLGKKGNWVRARFANGERGWIFRKLLWGSFGAEQNRKRGNQ
ncbi:MAG: SH3 domain-containing protein [Candidatus Binatia bacterium]